MATMLVILAGIMAAGGGAAFLINGAMDLRETSEDAAQSTPEFSNSRLEILQASIQAGADGGLLLEELVRAQSGTGDVDLTRLTIAITAGGLTVQFHHDGNASATSYVAEIVRDPDGSFPAIDVTDLVTIRLNLDLAGLVVSPGSTITQSQASEGVRLGQDRFEAPQGGLLGTLDPLDVLK